MATTVSIAAQMAQQNMRQLMTQHAEPAWLIQRVMHHHAHLPVGAAPIARREAGSVDDCDRNATSMP